MSFAKCKEVIGAAMFVKFVENEESQVMAFVGEPIPRDEVYLGKKRTRAYFPVLTYDGLQVWGVPTKVYRELEAHWDKYDHKWVDVTRHGEKGSRDTKYDLKIFKPNAKLTKAIAEITPKMVQEILANLDDFTPTADDEIPI